MKMLQLGILFCVEKLKVLRVTIAIHANESVRQLYRLGSDILRHTNTSRNGHNDIELSRGNLVY